MSPSKGGTAAQLRAEVEQARLELRALFRALDQLEVAQELPRQLHVLMALDADLAEALWVLGQASPGRRFDLRAMARDTRASISRVPGAREAFLATLDAPMRAAVLQRATELRPTLEVFEAYRDLPGNS